MCSKTVSPRMSALSALLFAGATMALASNLSFVDSRRSYAAGNVPVGVTVADFNSDSKPDLAVANAFGNNVTILSGDGTGTYQPAYQALSLTGPGAIAAGDFNGDAVADVVVAGTTTHSIYVALGRGNGTFRQPKVARGIARGPNFVATSDFNGDGKLDVLVLSTGETGNAVTVLLGNGDGTLQAPLYSAAGGPATDAAIADFNSDGSSDVAVLISGSSRIAILLGNRNGKFQAPVPVAVGTAVNSLALGHFNTDGYADLLVACGSQPARVLLGLGNGTFLAPAVVADMTGEMAVEADINLDGRSDAVVLSSAGSLKVALSNIDGSFLTLLKFSVESGYMSPISTNLNGDATGDIVAVNSVANVVSVMLGAGTQSFLSVPQFGVSSASLAVSGDMNRDGNMDLIVSGSGGTQILRGSGAGSFAPYPGNTLTGGVALAVADLDLDGKLDVIVAVTDDLFHINIHYCREYVNGQYTICGYIIPSFSFQPTSAIAVADLNGDTWPDLVVGGRTSSLTGYSLLVALGSPGFQFQAPYLFDTGAIPVSIAVGDFNEDAKMDLAVASSTSNNVEVFLGSGNGGFTTRNFFYGGTSPVSVVAGDFDRDGHLDLAAAASISNNVTLMLGNGDGSFRGFRTYPTLRGTQPNSAVAADFDGDGWLDLAVGNSDPAVTILRGFGDGTFDPAIAFGLPGPANAMALADYTRDGKPDLAVASTSLGVIGMLINTSQP